MYWLNVGLMPKLPILLHDRQFFSGDQPPYGDPCLLPTPSPPKIELLELLLWLQQRLCAKYAVEYWCVCAWTRIAWCTAGVGGRVVFGRVSAASTTAAHDKLWGQAWSAVTWWPFDPTQFAVSISSAGRDCHQSKRCWWPAVITQQRSYVVHYGTTRVWFSWWEAWGPPYWGSLARNVNIYISRLCYDVSVRLSVRLSVCLWRKCMGAL